MAWRSAFLLLSTLPFIFPYKILVYNPRFGHSHSSFLGRIAEILAEEGHNVTSLIPIMNPSVKDGTHKSHKIFVQPDPDVQKMYETPSSMNPLERNLFNPLTPFSVGQMFSSILGKTCSKILAEERLIETLREEKYDVFIVENCEVCGIGISEAIQAKSVIGAASTCLYGPQLDEYGIERAISYRSTLFHSSLNVHSFLSRLTNIIGELFLFIQFGLPRRAASNALSEHFGPLYPTIAEQSSRVAYIFTNCEPLIDSAVPTLNRVIDISQLGHELPKKLDEYWEGVLTLRSRTILFSFGSVVKSYLLPDSIKASIIKCISRFPDITFIWKYEQTDDEFSRGIAPKMDNLVFTQWMPQREILNHANVVAFITHGGMGSVQETVAMGVPGIFIPIFGDQPRNARMMEINGLGVVMDKFELGDEEKLVEKIREVIDNPKYRENSKRISRMLASKPFSAREKLVRYVEFAAEFGPSSALRPLSQDMNFVQYHNLDIISIALVLVLSIVVTATKCIVLFVRKMLR